jgi:hypothetical protein
MHLAFIGACPLTSELVLAAISLGHRVTWFTSEGDRSAAGMVLEGSHGGQIELAPEDTWEALLDSPSIGGVVLAEAAARDVELRTDQWRRLAQAGSRLLFIHPLVPSLLVYLEVDMLARESGAVLMPYWPDACSPAAADLGEMAAGAADGAGEGPVEQVTFRRLLEDRSQPAVTKWFARDAALLDLAAGPFTEISAIGPDASDAAYASLAVHLHGPGGLPVRWEVGRAQEGIEARMTASGSGGDRHVTLAGPPRDRVEKYSASAESLAAVEAFVANVNPCPPLLDWNRCVRAMELADSIEISLRRGRRIDVYYRQLTEETSYKGVMSAFGCGLLLFAPVVLFMAGVVNAVFGWRLTRFWYLPVLVILVAFLVVQLFARLMARRPPPAADATSR